jgi:hypothetical protein
MTNIKWYGRTSYSGFTTSNNISTEIVTATLYRANDAQAAHNVTVSEEVQLRKDRDELASSIEADSSCTCRNLCVRKKWGICIGRTAAYLACRSDCIMRRAGVGLAKRVLAIAEFLVKLAIGATIQSARIARGALLLLTKLPKKATEEIQMTDLLDLRFVQALGGQGPFPELGYDHRVSGSVVPLGNDTASFDTGYELKLRLEMPDPDNYGQATEQDNISYFADGVAELVLNVAADVADSSNGTNSRRLSSQDNPTHAEVENQLQMLSRKLRSARNRLLVVDADLAAAHARISALPSVAFATKGLQSRALAKLHKGTAHSQFKMAAKRLQVIIHKVLASSDQMMRSLQKLPHRPRSLVLLPQEKDPF